MMILFGLILAFGCEPQSPAVTAPRAARPRVVSTTRAAAPVPEVFDYTGHLGATPLVRGTLELVVEHGEFVSGTWKLARVAGGGPANVGPQVGEGELTITKPAGRLVLNTTNIADHEVIMVADVVAVEEFSGVWQYRSFSGVEAEGRFVARRRK
jgi:hypothetical protein